MGRPILVRHRDFSLYRPTAFVIARMITDIPSIVAQATTFSIVYYFMCGFQADAGKFFTFWIMSIILALVLTQMYRFIGSAFTAFDNAAKVSGFWVVILMLYAGYFIPYQNMHVWFFWLSWLSPAFYAYESYMGNEFGGLLLACTGQQLIPNGASYNNTSNQVCAVAGVSNDGLHVVGSDYITQSYSFKVDHVWRNFGTLNLCPSNHDVYLLLRNYGGLVVFLCCCHGHRTRATAPQLWLLILNLRARQEVKTYITETSRRRKPVAGCGSTEHYATVQRALSCSKRSTVHLGKSLLYRLSSWGPS